MKLIGGLLLLWIAVKLATGEDAEGGHGEIEETDNLWKAVRTVAIADAVMSLDNVLAIAAASHGNVWLFVFGLALTIPLIIAGSGLVLGLIERFPLFVWAGAALLGWIAGDMIVNDPVILKQIAAYNPGWVKPGPSAEVPLVAGAIPHYGAAVLGLVLTLAIALFARSRRAAKHA